MMPTDTLTTPDRALGRLQRVRPAELFDAWLFAEAEATLALRAWRSASWHDKRNAYATYLAAFDRETHAARVLSLRVGAG